MFESLEVEKLSNDQILQLQAEILGYKKMPPTIEEFVLGDYYLGKMFGNGGLYPYWLEVLKEIYPTPIHTRYPFVIFTGPIGGGKSTVTKIMAMYTLCRLGHLNNFNYFGVVISKTIDWIFFHTSNEKAWSDSVNGCWNYYNISPYFQTEFQWSDRLYKFVADGPRTNKSIGGDAIFYHFSEVNFVAYHTAKYKIDQSFDRYKSRFLKIINYFGGIVIDSSAAGDNSIVDYLIKEYPGLKVWRDPIWKVKEHLGIYFREGSFKVYTGDSVNEPFIIDEEHPVTDDHDPDKVLDIPMELYANYKSDIVLSLQNTAGISTTNTDLFFTDKEKLKEAFTIPNHIPDIIVADFYDDEQYWDQVREQIMRIPKEKILYIGIDMGVSGDLCGFAISYFDDWIYKEGKPTIEYTTKTPVAFGISRKPGQETNITKVFNLIKEINNHYEIGAVVTDQYQSTQLRQDLKNEEIYCYLSSVDRTMDPYIYLKVQIYKGYCKIVNNKYLKSEVFQLINTGYKIEHTSDSSKDISDAVCNSHYAIKINIGTASDISTKASLDAQIRAMRVMDKGDAVQNYLKSRTF